MGMLDDLRDQVLKLAQEMPDEPDAMMLMAKHLLAFGEVSRAVALSRAAFKSNPSHNRVDGMVAALP